MTALVIRITVNGKLALTVEQAAERYGLAPSSMRGELSRLKGVVTPIDFDGRKKLYLARELDQVMRARPGKGAPGVPRSAPDARSRRAAST